MVYNERLDTEQFVRIHPSCRWRKTRYTVYRTVYRTSEVLVRSILAPVRFASPSILSVPWVLVLMVLMGLYW